MSQANSVEIDFTAMDLDDQITMVKCIDRMNKAANTAAKLAAEDAFYAFSEEMYEKYNNR